MLFDLKNSRGIKATGRLASLKITAENVAEQEELAVLAAKLLGGPIYPGQVAPVPEMVRCPDCQNPERSRLAALCNTCKGKGVLSVAKAEAYLADAKGRG